MTIIFFAAILSAFTVKSVVDFLNRRHAETAKIPADFADLDTGKFRQSQEYLRAQTSFALVQRTFSTALSLAAIAFGWLGFLDHYVRSFGMDERLNGLLFFFLLMVILEVASMPFSFYHTFRLEEKFGFNRSSLGTFVGDQIKGWVLGIVIGGPLLWAILWFFERGGAQAWLYAWGALSTFTLVLSFLAPVLLMPLFYKFDPLQDGELKTGIEAYAKREKFQMKGVYTMDGSRRSSKANAFFTGFGPFRRIVLFDTLIAKHSVNELLAVLAHEVGHYKLGHTKKLMGISLVTTFILFFALSLVMRHEEFSHALGFTTASVYSGMMAAALLYGPLSLLLEVMGSAISRKFEYEADAFAARTTGKANDLIVALKNLSTENLSNLTPHPWKVMLEYSHPPVTDRMKALARL